jgi:hypothetical protein
MLYFDISPMMRGQGGLYGNDDDDPDEEDANNSDYNNDEVGGGYDDSDEGVSDLDSDALSQENA